MFVVIVVTTDDPYGAEWVYGPYADYYAATREAENFERGGTQYARVREMLTGVHTSACAGMRAAQDNTTGE